MTLSQAQREAREGRVGASEVAALLIPSQHPFTTPRAIYDRIVEGTASEGNDATRDGQLAEPHILAMAREKYNLHAIACTRAYAHPYLPVSASPDAYLGDGQGLVEIKATSAQWASQPPAYVVAQVQAQLWLCRRSYAQVVVWGGRLRMYYVERDDALVGAIREGVEKFWREHLVPRVPPPAPITSHPTFELRNIRS